MQILRNYRMPRVDLARCNHAIRSCHVAYLVYFALSQSGVVGVMAGRRLWPGAIEGKKGTVAWEVEKG